MNWGNAIRMFVQVRDAAQLLRSVDSDDMLGYVGLQKKQSTLTSVVLPGIGFFAAGLAAGAGIGLLFAPSSGKELRGQISDKLSEVKDKVSDATAQLRDQVAGGQFAPGTASSEQQAVESGTSGGQGRYM